MVLLQQEVPRLSLIRRIAPTGSNQEIASMAINAHFRMTQPKRGRVEVDPAPETKAKGKGKTRTKTVVRLPAQGDLVAERARPEGEGTIVLRVIGEPPLLRAKFEVHLPVGRRIASHAHFI